MADWTFTLELGDLLPRAKPKRFLFTTGLVLNLIPEKDKLSLRRPLNKFDVRKHKTVSIKSAKHSPTKPTAPIDGSGPDPLCRAVREFWF